MDVAPPKYASVSLNSLLYDDPSHTQPTRKRPPSPSFPPAPSRSGSDARAATRDVFPPRRCLSRRPHRKKTRVHARLTPHKASSASRHQNFGDFIDLHIADMRELGKPPRRSRVHARFWVRLWRSAGPSMARTFPTAQFPAAVPQHQQRTRAGMENGGQTKKSGVHPTLTALKRDFGKERIGHLDR